MLRMNLERFPDVGIHQHYKVTIGSVSGEIYSVPEMVETCVDDLLCELRQIERHLNG